MDQGANVILISLFSGFNIAFAILSLFIWKNEKSRKLYFYFGLFSLFSALYFLLSASSIAFQIDLYIPIIFCAAIYYGIFPWLILELIENKNKTIPFLLSFIFAFAFFTLILYTETSDYAAWQIIAHIGLLGLCLVVAYTAVVLKKRKITGANVFMVLSVVFIFISFDELISSYTDSIFLSEYITFLAPLDIYPILFTSILGARFSVDFYSTNKMKIKLLEAEINEKQLQLVKAEKIQLQQEIRFKNDDLTSFGVEITKNRDFIKSLHSRLLSLENADKISYEDIKGVSKTIKTQLLTYNDLNLFNRNVEKVNHAFRAKLKESYPSLTPNEIHLASLLFLNLNTKEIAAIKNISPNSVKVLRYRLRKKLNLETSVNLSEFLNNWAN